MTREIPLTKGFVALVDDADYDALHVLPWRVGVTRGRAYALWRKYVGIREGKSRYTEITMHRHLTDAPAGFEIDHINGNALDNRRSNLRVCTRAENARNVRCRGPGFKGVERKLNRFRARIAAGGRRITLGYYVTEVDAARAYDAAARQHHGQFARLNFPEPHEQSALLSPSTVGDGEGICTGVLMPPSGIA